MVFNISSRIRKRLRDSSHNGMLFLPTPGATSKLAMLAGVSASGVGSPVAHLSVRRQGMGPIQRVVVAEPQDETTNAEPSRFSLQHVCFGPLEADEELAQRSHLIEKWDWYTTQIAAASLAPKAHEIGQLSEDEIIAAIAAVKLQLDLVPNASKASHRLLEHAKTFMTANGFELFGVTTGGRPIYGLGATQVLEKKCGAHWYLHCCPDHLASSCGSDDDLNAEEKIMKKWTSLGMRFSDFRIEIEFGIENMFAVEVEYTKLTVDWRRHWVSNIVAWDEAWERDASNNVSTPISTQKDSKRKFLGKYLVAFMDKQGYQEGVLMPEDEADQVFIRHEASPISPTTESMDVAIKI